MGRTQPVYGRVLDTYLEPIDGPGPAAHGRVNPWVSWQPMILASLFKLF
jgi:hypothetical protein